MKNTAFKKQIFVLPLLAVLSTPVHAEDVPAAAGEGAKARPEMSAEKFAERKAEILKRMDERAAKIQERKACVTAATTPEALKACRPERHDGQKNK